MTENPTLSGKPQKQFSTLDLVCTAIFAALMAVCSWISIPTLVPFTLQTFAVFLTLQMIGGRRGFFAILVYILLGAVGVPVFAEFTSGPSILFGSTGGYLIGFLFTALLYWGATNLLGEKLYIQILSLVLGMLVCYAFGTAWFMIVYTYDNGAVGLWTALSWCVLPFLLPDAAKLAASVALTAALKKRVTL